MVNMTVCVILKIHYWIVHRLALGLPAAGRSRSAGSGSNRSMSPGWHERALQIASRVEKRIARALPVLRIERLASVMPTRSASSVSVIRRSWSRSSSLTAIAMSHRPFEVFAHVRASANTRASRNVRNTASQPLIEKPASMSTGYAGVETVLAIAPMTRLRSCNKRGREENERGRTLEGGRERR
jgi:hypothetical protein